MSAPLEMERAGRWELAPALVLAGAALSLAFDQLRLRAGALEAEAAALLSLPPAWFWWPAAAAVLASSVPALATTWGRGDARWVRAHYVLTVLILGVAAGMLPGVRLPQGATSDGLAWVALEAVEGPVRASLAQGGPPDAERLLEAAQRLGPPAYLRRGEAVRRWEWVVALGCEAPALAAEGEGAGTLILCVAPGGGEAWIAAVGTGGKRFAEASLAQDPSGARVVRRLTLGPPPQP